MRAMSIRSEEGDYDKENLIEGSFGKLKSSIKEIS